ncbi:hypothetical protein [Psychrobacillus glaciei]|nr:hypothetical protein [Psychrobacillus glaciei]
MKKAILLMLIMAIAIATNMNAEKVEAAIDSNEIYEMNSFPIHPPIVKD